MTRRSRFQPWAECYICGEDHPQDEMVRHVRLGQLVDKDCADELGYEEIFAKSNLPREEARSSERPVQDQGGNEHIPSYLQYIRDEAQPYMLMDTTDAGVVYDVMGNGDWGGVGSITEGAFDPQTTNHARNLGNNAWFLPTPFTQVFPPGMTYETWFRGDFDALTNDGIFGLWHQSNDEGDHGFIAKITRSPGARPKLDFKGSGSTATFSVVIELPQLSWNYFAFTFEDAGDGNYLMRAICNTTKYDPGTTTALITPTSNRLVYGASVMDGSDTEASSGTPTNPILGQLYGGAIYRRILSYHEMQSHRHAGIYLPY